ncbi:MAG: PAS domain S-box protein [Acidobacteria bacterium]|nr:PAS domain S-box protein [Acidobacteriota bacterium]MBI3663025.1 PAS domain S-box protein [Acidobacteriota bacterium]
MISERLRYLLQVVVFAVIYSFAAKIGLSLASANQDTALFWPPSGLSVGVLILFGYRLWPGIAIGSLLLSLLAGNPLLAAIGVTIGNILQGLVGAYLFRRYADEQAPLESLRGALVLLGPVAAVGSIVSATIGTLSLSAGGVIPWANLPSAWVFWCLGDGLSINVMVPILLALKGVRWRGWAKWRVTEAVVLGLVLFVVGNVVFGTWLPIDYQNRPKAYLLLPIFLWGVFRFGQKGGATSVLGIAILAIWGTVNGHGPFGGQAVQERALALFGYLSTITVASQMVGGIITQRERSREQLGFQARILTNVSDAVISTDTNFHFTSWNPAAERIYGWKAEEILGRSLSEILQCRYPDTVSSQVRQTLAEKGHITSEVVHTKKDGTTVFIETKGIAVRGEEGQVTGYVHVNRDITERKRAAEALHQSEAKFSKAFRTSPDAILLSDLESGMIFDVNDAFEKLSGFRREEVLGKRSIDLNLWPKPEQRATAVAELRRAGRVRDFPFEFRTKTGELGAGVFSGEIIQLDGKPCMLTVVRDVTDARRAEEALRQSEARFSLLFRSSPDAIAVVEYDSGKYLDVNDGFLAMTGYRRAEVIGKTSMDFGLWAEASDRSRIREELMKDGAIRNMLVQLRSRAGDVRDMLISAELIELEGVRCALAVARDVTTMSHAQQALRDSEEKFSTAFQSSPDAITINTLAEGRYVEVNDSFLRLSGFQRDEVIGRTGPELQIWMDPAERAAVLSKLREQGAVRNMEYTFRMKSGELIDTVLSAEVIKLSGELHTLWVVRDIREKKRAERALRESEERYRSIVETTSEWIWELDREGRHLYDNQAVESILGYRSEEIRGKDIGDLLHEGDREEVARVLAQMMAEKRGWRNWVSRWRRRDGSYRYLESNAVPVLDEKGELTGYRGTERDVTERVMAEAALRASEERYRELFENANDIIYTHDLEGRFTSLNKAAELATGYLRDEVIGKNVSEILTADTVEMALEMTMRKLARGGQTTYEVAIAAKDGRRVTLEVSSRLIYQDGRPLGIQGVGRDISERKLLEDQLRQAQKMEAVGRLAGGVAHDFNNLLMVIRGHGELALGRMLSSDPLRSSVEEMYQAADRAAGLTQQLLAFSRKQVLQPQVLDLNAIVTNMERLLRRLIGEHINLTTLCDPVLGQVQADPGQIEQVLMNLVVNARDAMADGGRLTIETHNVELDADFARQHPSVAPGRHVLLAVGDTGHGMNEETRARIFEPFFTTKELSKGTGLGLSMVYGIVKQSGGSIWVESSLGRGTTFKIFFPRVDKPVESGKADAKRRGPLPGTETVLLVEDEQAVRYLARDFLRALGYTVIEAGSGAEALRLSEAYHAEIHLLMTDVVMPGMSGRELATRLLQRRPATKVLYVSGYTDDAIGHHGVLSPGTAFLQKPFPMQALARKIREVLDVRGSG